MIAEPGSDFRLDCEPCVKAIQRGKSWATSAARPLARVFDVLFTAIDDVPPESFVRMPAHCSLDDVGRVSLGDGSLMTAVDRMANELADTYAKQAVEEHRVPPALRSRVKEAAEHVRKIAMWLGRVTHLASNQPGPQRRDSEATRRGPCPRRWARMQAPKRSASTSSLATPPGGLRLLARLEPLRQRVAARAAAAEVPS